MYPVSHRSFAVSALGATCFLFMFFYSTICFSDLAPPSLIFPIPSMPILSSLYTVLTSIYFNALLVTVWCGVRVLRAWDLMEVPKLVFWLASLIGIPIMVGSKFVTLSGDIFWMIALTSGIYAPNDASTQMLEAPMFYGVFCKHVKNGECVVFEVVENDVSGCIKTVGIPVSNEALTVSENIEIRLPVWGTFVRVVCDNQAR